MKRVQMIGILLMVAALLFTMTACGGTKQDDDYSSPTREELEQEVDFEEAEATGEIYTAESGQIVIPAAYAAAPVEERITDAAVLWEGDVGNAADFTMPESVILANGSLGTLSIPSINLSVGIFETDDEIESMAYGVAHLTSTSTWDGNVGLAGHNRGVNTYFGRIHELKSGDVIQLDTALGTRRYTVQTSKVIDEYDWSMLGRTEHNAITLITCLDNQPSKRLCVQAVEAS